MPEPLIDPGTGDPVVPEDAPKTVSIEEFNQLKGKLDAFETMYKDKGTLTPAPVAPSGPTFEEQVSEITSKIDKIDDQIDEALANGKPIKALNKQRDVLLLERTTLQVRGTIEPQLANGLQTLNSLTERVTKGDMPYLDLVKDDYEAGLQTLTPEAQADPAVRLKVYQFAVGMNVDKVHEARNEERLRREADQAALEAPRSSPKGKNYVPKPSEIWPKDTIRMIRESGSSPEKYVQTVLGYADWNEYWEKSGKDYFGEQFDD